MNDPQVSVCLITYQHELYIRQALESILMQKVNFSWEIIIADDCSKDGTQKIILEYQQKYPGLIRSVFQKENVGGGKNFVDLIYAAKGKYVAYLEGDDYWTDPLKLQKQFDFMEANTDFSLCYHKIKWTHTYPVNGDSEQQSNVNDPKISTIEDVINKGWFIRSCTMFFKNISLPANFEKLHVGDYPLHVLLANEGKIGFIDICMAVYRINDKGVSETNLITTDVKKRKAIVRSEIDLIKYIDYHTAYKFHNVFSRKLFDVMYSHLIFLRNSSKKDVIPDFIYLAKHIGIGKISKGIINKILHKRKKVHNDRLT